MLIFACRVAFPLHSISSASTTSASGLQGSAPTENEKSRRTFFISKGGAWLAVVVNRHPTPPETEYESGLEFRIGVLNQRPIDLFYGKVTAKPTKPGSDRRGLDGELIRPYLGSYQLAGGDPGIICLWATIEGGGAVPSCGWATPTTRPLIEIGQQQPKWGRRTLRRLRSIIGTDARVRFECPLSELN